MRALVIGRFHAVTRAQAEWLASLKQVDSLVAVITSADHSGTRRNPMPVEQRESMLRPALERSGLPSTVVRVRDIAQSDAWVRHVVAEVARASKITLEPASTLVLTANHDVADLFTRAGYRVETRALQGCTPAELVERVAEGRPWEDEASPETRAIFNTPAVRERLRAIFGQRLVNDDGELGHQRDFASYGAQMDASLKQKLDDLVRWIQPGCIVDKGCGTGKLMVELSRLFPQSSLVGVDLSREFLRRCDENTYFTEDVSLVCANIIERNVAPGSATSVVYSSVMHEVHSYTGYDVGQIHRALDHAFIELAPGGHVLIRDGVSPPVATWRLELLNEETVSVFERFAREFAHGRGVQFEQLARQEFRLSAHDANEFLCKKDYLKNWHIEVHEEYGPLTLDGWDAALRRAGFVPVHLHSYVNPWIAEHRYQGSAVVKDDTGLELPWPATNCVVVGRKPAN